MKNRIIKILIFILFISPASIKAETTDLRIANEDASYNAKIFLTLDVFDASSSTGIFNIWINPESQSINASGVVLGYASSSINILGALTGNSFCDFFLDNSFDNNTGVLKLSGMKPYPGVATTSLLGQILFEKINTATTTIYIQQDQSMVLANNGFATNILASTTDLKL